MIETEFKGFEKLLAALADGASTGDIRMLFDMHHMVLEIKNLIQENYDVHVEYNYVKKDGYYKLEMAFNPCNYISNEQAEALKELVDIYDGVYTSAKSINSKNTKKK